jgi:hypothetical protein
MMLLWNALSSSFTPIQVPFRLLTSAFFAIVVKPIEAIRCVYYLQCSSERNYLHQYNHLQELNLHRLQYKAWTIIIVVISTIIIFFGRILLTSIAVIGAH